MRGMSEIGWLPPLNNPRRPSQTSVEIHQFLPNDSHVSRPYPVLYLTFTVDFESDSQDASTRQKTFPGLLDRHFILRQEPHRGSIDRAVTACLPAIKSDENRITFSRKHLGQDKFSSPEPCTGHELFYKIDDFFVDAVRRYYQIHKSQRVFFELNIRMVTVVPDDELKSWHSWLDAKVASDPKFMSEFRQALSRPRTEEELFYEERVQTRRSGSSFDLTGKSCSICLDEFSAASNKLTQLPCAHVFHSSCISKWLERKFMCPFCRFQGSSYPSRFPLSHFVLDKC